MSKQTLVANIFVTIGFVIMLLGLVSYMLWSEFILPSLNAIMVSWAGVGLICWGVLLWILEKRKT